MTQSFRPSGPFAHPGTPANLNDEAAALAKRIQENFEELV